MSNDLALAAVTATLRDVLDEALGHPSPQAVGGSTVTTLRPDRLADRSGPALNLFLYAVSPSARHAPDDLPVRRPDGTLVAPPLVALELHYLISAYGSDDHLDAHRMLGRAVSALAGRAVLTRDRVRAALTTQGQLDGMGFLEEADLADQVEPVRVSPLALTTDEQVRLWSGFGQAPYVLSVAYAASPVLVRADIAASPALPVRDRQVGLSVAPPPRLDAVRSDLGPGRAAADSTVTLGGSWLGDGEIVVGPRRFTPATVAATRLTFDLDATVPAGVHPVTVLRPDEGAPPGDDPPSGPRRLRSNPAALAVVPTVTAGAAGTTVTLTVVPPLFPGQRAHVSFTRLDDGSPRTHDHDPLPVTGADPVSTIEVEKVPPGRWLVRVRVDGVDSVPELVDGRFGAPAVTVPSP